MFVELRPLTAVDAEAHCAGEDDESVRWLSGGYATTDDTRAYFEELAENARLGEGKRAFGIWYDGRLAGYAEFDPDVVDGLREGDVNLAYSVHPWARGHGVAVVAVGELCRHLATEGIGTYAAIRVEPENTSSVRVAQKAGFRFAGEFVSDTGTHPDGMPATMRLYRLDLGEARRPHAPPSTSARS